MPARHRKNRAMVGSVLYAVLIAAVAVIVWPSQLGGPGTLSVVSGHSMDPTYATGDLIYAWTGTPRTGDIVVYSPGPGLGRVVHRVVGGNATDGYVMQGDNNSWQDPYQPTGDDVLGIVRVHIPTAGKFASILNSPLTWAAVILIGLGLIMWPTSPASSEQETQDCEPHPST